ncbi:carbohydrate ABC transporter permease [Actinopolymorpha pittospori]|uniref:ABC-type glycerol-3-phosphate transport system permease component n=1 Tax=Actinopolymorpha pittospori TaxID=648752 RepID=A0A927N4C5_9ACTN|nr:carbohydrate ABC transporter permease [Actinopolymorpha pittospori]MBE1608335.1 ABC-type glycerol-3-phosphate transport system permease component [Actinopolymorpha pittospori]
MAIRTMAPRASHPIWIEKPSVGTRIVKVVTIAVIVIVMLFPFLYVLAVSLSTQADLAGSSVTLIPKNPTLEAYRQILAGGVVTRALVVSICVTVVGTVVSMVMTTTLAYGLTRTRQVPGSRLVLLMVLGTLLFSAGIIPNYLLVRYLGMLDSYAALIVPGLISAFNLVVVRQFFMNIPEELTDAARIDGAGTFQVFWHIILPLSKAVLAVVALFYGVALWSDFFNALIYLNDTTKWPVQLVLRLFVLQGQNIAQSQQVGQPAPPAETVQMAVVIIATAPIILVYPFLQKYFTQGVLSGAVKG